MQSKWKWSASSWGCELKYCLMRIFECHASQPLREAVSWNYFFHRFFLKAQTVSLFVRLWVEIVQNDIGKHLTIVSLFVRLWVEMSDNWRLRKMTNRQPLREAVSWNNFSLHNGWLSILSASSWGCELKCAKRCWNRPRSKGQPLREAVSWNIRM